MKTQQELREEAKAKIDELTTKINSLRANPLEDIVDQKKLDGLIGELEKARDDIKSKYVSMKAAEEEKWDKFEKNVYQDMESFNRAFEKAGTIFKPGRSKSD